MKITDTRRLLHFTHSESIGLGKVCFFSGSSEAEPPAFRSCRNGNTVLTLSNKNKKYLTEVSKFYKQQQFNEVNEL